MNKRPKVNFTPGPRMLSDEGIIVGGSWMWQITKPLSHCNENDLPEGVEDAANIALATASTDLLAVLLSLEWGGDNEAKLTCPWCGALDAALNKALGT